MGTYDTLDVGRRIVGPPRVVTEDDARTLIGLLGYTHPLFADPTYARDHTPFGTTPLPGELTLAVMGGLAEQTDIFDDTVIALVGIDNVRFPAAALPGVALHLEMEVTAKSPSSSGRRGTVTFAWRCLTEEGTAVVEADATLLFRVDD